MTSTRRELLGALLGLPAAGWACRRGATSVGWDGVDLDDGRSWGHALRDAASRPPADEPDREADVVVVGGGISGLSAAWRLARRGRTDVVVLEAHREVGGTSRGGRSAVSRYPWGAHYVPVPGPGQPELRALLKEMGALVEGPDGGFAPSEELRITEPEERSFHRGQWHAGLFPFLADHSRRERRRFFRAVDQWVRFRDADGRRAFTVPFAAASQDPRLAALDQMTFAEWLDGEGFEDPGLRWLTRYASRDDYGTEPEQLSAWYGLAYFASRAEANAAESAPFVAWPEGNARIAAHLAEAVGVDRVRTGQVVTQVQPRGGRSRCRVQTLDADGRSVVYAARSVVFALPSYLRPYLLPEPLRGAYAPEYAPWVVSNVHLSGRPSYRGFETAWDNVIVDSDALGYVVATHQGGSAYGPTVWTHYIAGSGADARAERSRVGTLSWRDATDAVFNDLARAHLDLERFVERIDVMRWGHGMVRPEPGLAFSRERNSACTHVDGVHFAHTDLSGAALLEEAVHHGVRAADEIIAEAS